MRKLLTFILALTILLVAGLQSTAFAVEFPDVSVTHLNYDAIMYLTKLGVIAGYDDGTFCPDKQITRTEFCALMSRTLGYNKDTYEIKDVPFTDVSKEYWGRAYISFCYEKKLINGMGEGIFAPADKVTLGQVAKMVVCAIDRENEALKLQGEKWYSGYMKTAKLYGLLQEINQDPAEYATRANVAQFVYNMVESQLLPEEDEIPNEPETETEIPNDEPEVIQPDDEDDETSTEKEDTDDEPDSKVEGVEKPGFDFSDKELLEIERDFAEKDFSDVRVIVVDAGHNYSGKDIGARFDELNLKEEEITWQIADKLRRKLEKLGYEVYMTRDNMCDSIAPTSQVDSLQARVDLSHTVRADLFISVHCNMGGGRGTETYCFRLGGYAARLAKIVQRNITDATGLYDRGVKTANFYVNKNTLMPSILIETGFMDNLGDIEILTSEEGQNDIAKAVADAVVEYDSMDPIVQEKASETEADVDVEVIEIQE